MSCPAQELRRGGARPGKEYLYDTEHHRAAPGRSLTGESRRHFGEFLAELHGTGAHALAGLCQGAVSNGEQRVQGRRGSI